MTQSTVTPCLWFNGTALDAAEFYTRLFPASRIDHIDRYPDPPVFDTPFPQGHPLLVHFTLSGRPFQALNGGPQFPHSEAISLSWVCADAAEVDALWHALTADGGVESMCGWCRDRFGVSWQIVPQDFIDMQRSGQPTKIAAMLCAMRTMRKLDIDALQAAFDAA